MPREEKQKQLIEEKGEREHPGNVTMKDVKGGGGEKKGVFCQGDR